MNFFIAFLRGINVSGQKKIKMADLRKSLTDSGFLEVQTYIQSGNIVLKNTSTDVREIEAKINMVILRDFGFDVPVVVKRPSEIKEILRQNPFTGVAEEKNQCFTLLHSKPPEELCLNFSELQFENETFHLTDTCVFLNYKKGAGKSKLSNNLIERKLKVTATSRNLNTMRKMVEMTNQ